MKKNHFFKTLTLTAIAFVSVFILNFSSASADVKKTDLSLHVYAKGQYSNWDGVSNVNQFTDADGNYCFAFNKGKIVTVVKTKDGKSFFG
jgi:hypothetical protein